MLVTGAHGFVAGSVLAQAGAEWEVHAVSRAGPGSRSDRLCWHVCEPLERNQLADLFHRVSPDALIHTAAIADIDLAEKQPELARAVNVDLTRSLVSLCVQAGCKLVLCSTDTIFDGEHAPYDEEDLPGPVNHYAETKVEAEQNVSGLGAQAVIARLSLVVGLPIMGSGNSLLARMLPALKEGRPIAAPAQEVRTPVDVITAGRALLELAAGNHHGIFHLAGHDRLNRLEIAQKIARRFGFSGDLVIAQPAKALAGRAVRPRDVSLNTAKASAELETPMRTLDDGLSLILEATEALCL